MPIQTPIIITLLCAISYISYHVYTILHDPTKLDSWIVFLQKYSDKRKKKIAYESELKRELEKAKISVMNKHGVQFKRGKVI